MIDQLPRLPAAPRNQASRATNRAQMRGSRQHPVNINQTGRNIGKSRGGVSAGELEEILEKKELTPDEVMVIRQNMLQVRT